MLKAEPTERLPSRLVLHRHRSRRELHPAYELQVDVLREAVEQLWSVARDARVNDELVFVDQAQLGQGERELQAAGEQATAGLLLELLNGPRPNSRASAWATLWAAWRCR